MRLSDRDRKLIVSSNRINPITIRAKYSPEGAINKIQLNLELAND